VEDVFSAQNGDICFYQDGKIELKEQIPAEIIGVDRGRSLPLNSEVIRNRRRIAYNCSLFISAVIDKEHRLRSLQFDSIDILEENEWTLLHDEIMKAVVPLIEQKLSEYPKQNTLEDFIRGQIRRRVFNATDIKPVTFLQLHWEDNADETTENDKE
jgi:ribonuclease J